MSKTAQQIPEIGFLKLYQIIGNSETPALLPVGRTTFLNRVRAGIYPQPVKLGARSVAWRVSDIRALIESVGA